MGHKVRGVGVTAALPVNQTLKPHPQNAFIQSVSVYL